MFLYSTFNNNRKKGHTTTLKYGVNVSGGELEADGYDEILAGAGPSAVFGAQVRGFNYDNTTTTAMAKINFMAWPGSGFGVNVAAGDTDANGRDEILAAKGPGPTLDADIRFHQAIIDMAKNRRLSGIYATLIEQGRCFLLRRRLDDAAKCREEAAEHASLFEAIRAGHKATANKLVRSHLRSLLQQDATA